MIPINEYLPSEGVLFEKETIKREINIGNDGGKMVQILYIYENVIMK
jgi:hypothetical protein